MKNFLLLLFSTILLFPLHGQKQFVLTSPNGQLSTQIDVDKQLTYSITFQDKQVLDSSPITINMNNGKIWNTLPPLAGTSRSSVNQIVPSPFYRATEVQDNYNQLTLKFKNQMNVEFRAYDEGIAYRFVYTGKKPAIINDEEVVYNFPSDATATVPFVKTGNDGDFTSQFFNSFENEYTTEPLSKLNTQRLMFLLLVVDLNDGVKMCITESDF